MNVWKTVFTKFGKKRKIKNYRINFTMKPCTEKPGQVPWLLSMPRALVRTSSSAHHLVSEYILNFFGGLKYLSPACFKSRGGETWNGGLFSEDSCIWGQCSGKAMGNENSLWQ